MIANRDRAGTPRRLNAELTEHAEAYPRSRLRYNHRMSGGLRTFDDTLHVLVDDYRTRCLWFLRAEYYPETHAERLRVLGYIQKHGDREAHIRASHLRRWLLQLSNADSVAS
jgi:hypothetical protein